jgi:Na+:H+ antiporter, NhaA family
MHPKLPNKIEQPPPEAWEPARNAAIRLARPLESFLRVQASGGIMLLLVAIAAMVWANSPLKDSYHALWHTPLRLGIGSFVFEKDLHFWINEGLMVLFFFVVGLEIRREMHDGELSELRRAMLPIAAAIGGMLVPAVIYLIFVRSPETRAGWGVPMATDIAFAVGVLALLGRRVPSALRVLLLALAIIDDIGAIIVIALFYSSGVQWLGLGIAAAGVVATLALQRIGLRRPWLYSFPAITVWTGLLAAGIHPTLSGVIVGLLTPVRPWFGEQGFLAETSDALADFRRQVERPNSDPHELLAPLTRIQIARREALSPVVRLEAALNPMVAFGVMPLFALANAGVTVGQVDFAAIGAGAVAMGITFGLVIGKPLGIVGLSLLATKLGLCQLPRGLDWRGLLVVGSVGGIGFTMALFIAELAFRDPVYLGVAKLAVLVASALAAVLGLVFGVTLLTGREASAHAISLDEAERSTEL